MSNPYPPQRGREILSSAERPERIVYTLPPTYQPAPAPYVFVTPQQPYHYPAPYQPPAPRYVDGMSTGAHVRNVLLSIVTCGLWIPVYVLTYYLSRHRIS